MSRTSHVYILTNRHHTVLYVGATTNLFQRLEQHYSSAHAGFASRYRLRKLIYAEEFPTIMEAAARERQIKSWRREKKDELISSINPDWEELAI